MTSTTDLSTADVLAGMFTENTGRALCDSGDYYGRNWERNAGKTADDFLAAPAATVGNDGVTLDAFHFLNDRLEFDADAQSEFDAWVEANHGDDRESWFTLVDGFLADKYGDTENERFGVVNTYNHESALSTVLQFWVVDTEGDSEWLYGEQCILMVHGGADVRGGYTAPKFFTIHGEETCMFDDARAMIWCDGHVHTPPQVETLPTFDDTPPTPVSHQWMTDDAGYNWEGYDDRDGIEQTPNYSMSYGSTDPEIETNDDGQAVCPVEGCTGTLHAAAY